MRALPVLLVGGALLAAAPRLAVADEGDVELSAFRPAIDSRGYVTVDASQVLGSGEVSLGLVTTWGKGMLRFTDGDNHYEVSHILTPTLVAAFGLRPLGLELELGAALPFGVMAGARGPDSDGGTPSDPTDDVRIRFDGQGLGDASVHLKWRLAAAVRGGRPGAALIGSLQLPTAASGSWLGAGGPVPELGAVIDLERGRWKLAGNVGVRLAPERSFTDSMSAGGTLPVTGGTIRAGRSIPFGGAAALALSPDKVELVGELFGAAPIGGGGYFPLEALAGLKLYLARSSYLGFGAGAGLLSGGGNPDLRAYLGIVFEPRVGDRDGDGIADDRDLCPDDPEDFDGFEDRDGCPDLDNDQDGILDVDDMCPNVPEDRDGVDDEDGCPEGDEHDRDGDGILDHLDACPDDPEDFDGFEDDDGCPDVDNDRDGILDVDDLCPDEPEDFDGFEDRDGCPDPDNDRDLILDADDQCPGRDGQSREETAETYNGVDDHDGCPDRGPVTRTRTEIEVLDNIYFDYDSAVIQERSHTILRAVAMTILVNDDIKRVEVQGHTDERGSAAYNLDLSQRRAAAVVEFLVAEGVAASRLVARGFGESKPLIRKSTPAAWSKNRRVEFILR
jgi:OmpA-OmpF porin, OOP family